MEQEKGCTSCKKKGFQNKHLRLLVISVLISVCTLYGFISIVRDLINFIF